MSTPFHLTYLATPYSRYKAGLNQAFIDAARLTAQLLQAGVKAYSPIAHTHPVAHFGRVDPLDHKIWLPFDQAMMDRCDVLIVAHMQGWEESFGIQQEIKYFATAKKPIFDLDPVSLVMTRRGSAQDLSHDLAGKEYAHGKNRSEQAGAS